MRSRAGPSRSRSSASGSQERSRPSLCTTRPGSASARSRAVQLTVQASAGVNSACHDPPKGGWMSSAPSGSGDRSVYQDDERLLHRLGYAQQLFRAMGGFQNFAISFTIISILAGCLTSYFVAFERGGPVAITYGWLLVGLFSTIIALAMAEIASAYPTAGGLYYWASKLGGAGWGWATGWFNLIGQVAVTAAIGYGLALFAQALFDFWFSYTAHMDDWFGASFDASTYILYAIFLTAAALVNM